MRRQSINSCTHNPVSDRDIFRKGSHPVHGCILARVGGWYGIGPAVFLFMFVMFFQTALLTAGEAGDLPLRPGELYPQPRQRGLNEVEALPNSQVLCPACGFSVTVADVGKLMRIPKVREDETPKWRLHAASRDTDLCPYPGPGKVSYQADIIICPDCGFSSPDFSSPLAANLSDWAKAILRPNIRNLQYKLLGPRTAGMEEASVVEFFNDQSEIPDLIRTEHARIYSLAAPLSKLKQAEASWLAAFAVRREISSPPRGAFLSKHRTNVDSALAKVKRQSPGLTGEEMAIRYFLGKKSSGRNRLSYADSLSARLLLAGITLRRGFSGQAQTILDSLLADCRNSFASSEQDPLWATTAPRSSRSYRLSLLNNVRNEAKREINYRSKLLASEQEYLKSATVLIREAIVDGECDGRPVAALFYTYLAGEFLRRTGNLPLATEWFKNIGTLAPDTSAVARAVQMQLELIRIQAEDQVTFLAAIGRDSDVFEKLREIVNVER